MKLFLSLILTLSFVGCKSKADLQAEYDSIVNEEASIEKAIVVKMENVDLFKDFPSEQAKQEFYYPAVRAVDSLKLKKEQLATRKAELAKELFK